MLMQLNPDHSAYVLKDRTGKYQDQCIDLIDEKLGNDLAQWLNEGEIVSNINPDLDILEGLNATDTADNAHQYYLHYQDKVKNLDAFKKAYIIKYKQLKQQEEIYNAN